MAMSLFQKARVVVESNLHELLDTQVNTPEGYKQLIRDLEKARADVGAGLDEGRGTANGYQRTLDELNSQKQQKQGSIDYIMSDGDPSNDNAAIELQLAVQDIDDQITEYTGLLADQQQQTEAIQQAYNQLSAKHQEMVTNLRRLQQTRAITQAQNRASSAVEAATEATSNVGSVDSIQANLDHKRDVANARFERVFGSLQANQSPEQVARLARAKAALEQRRQQLHADAVASLPAQATTTS